MSQSSIALILHFCNMKNDQRPQRLIIESKKLPTIKNKTILIIYSYKYRYFIYYIHGPEQYSCISN